MRPRHVVVLGLAAAVLSSAPAQAAQTVVVTGQDTLTWDKPLVDIQPGDTVKWTFAGTQQLHNVKSNSPNWNEESSPDQPAPDFSVTFNTEGEYAFVCRVHSDTMKGTVRVTTIPPPPPPPPPLSEQPFANDASEVLGPESVTLDREKPKLTSVRARRLPTGARVRFNVSEEAVVTVRLMRGNRVVKTARAAGKGLHGVTLRVRPGRYRVEVRAIDIAGNRTSWQKRTVTVR